MIERKKNMRKFGNVKQLRDINNSNNILVSRDICFERSANVY